MATATMTTEPTEQSAEEQLERARSIVTTLEADLVALPNQYATAAKRGDGGEMKRLRHARVDAEISLHAARVRAVRAELVALSAAAGALRDREGDVQREIATTDAELAAARLAFDEAERARNVAENAASSLRWQLQEAREQILRAQDKLAALVSAPMPD